LEGENNALGAFGYNRDGKRGKRQIVIGLLCDAVGEAVSIEVFAGNTQDPKTFGSRVRKVTERFGGGMVTLVGDRGMIKHPQMLEVQAAGFHHITAITKPQIEKLLKTGILQMELFDRDLAEVEVPAEGIRYLVRRNPERAVRIRMNRESKRAALRREVEQRNQYLAAHPRARLETALRGLRGRVARLKLNGWVQVEGPSRRLRLVEDALSMKEEARLDGCYVIQTDLTKTQAGTQEIHDRYRSLAEVERAFRTSKTVQLEMRPVYVRRESSTRGHALVVMLAYQVVRHLQHAWVALDLTVEEGLAELRELCSMKMAVGGQSACHRIPTPRPQSARLLEKLSLKLPRLRRFASF
jgi:transposase